METAQTPEQDWKVWYDRYVAEGAKIFRLNKKIKELQREIEAAQKRSGNAMAETDIRGIIIKEAAAILNKACL